MDILFVIFCTILVILMQLGFALLEAGLLPSKHAVSVIFKNFADFAVGFLAFFFLGYWIFKGFDSSLHPVNLVSSDPENAEKLVEFLYQAAFATTAATICSGAIAGRMKLSDYLIMSTFISGIIYPFLGYILWEVLEKEFTDYAGSIVVHATGGAAALAATLLIGWRSKEERKLRAHNLPLTTIGAFLLLIGWYGFNMGSTQLSLETAEGLHEISLVAINTTLAATVSMSVAIFLSWWKKIPRLTIAINGLLGGLVGITASPDVAIIWYPFFVGGLCGWVVFLYSRHIIKNRLSWKRMDDPVGAVVVHLVCGVIGGSAVGIIRFLQGENYLVFMQILISWLAPIFVFLIFAVILFLLHGALATGRKERISPNERNHQSFQKFFGSLNRLQSETSDIDRGLDYANHQEVAYDIRGDLETPRIIKDRIDGLFRDYIKPERREEFDDVKVFSPKVKDAKESFTYEEAAEARNISDDLTDEERASYPPFSAPFRLWLDRSSEIVKMYIELYGEVIFPENKGVMNGEEFVKGFNSQIKKLERYRFEDGDNRKKVFEDTMQEILDLLLYCARMTDRWQDEAVRRGVEELTAMSNQISELKTEVERLKSKNQ